MEKLNPQDFYSNVFVIGGKSPLLSVNWPLELLIVSQIAAHDVNTVGRALQEPVNALWERGFAVKIIFTDPEKAFVSARSKFPGTRVDTGGAGDHVSQADIWIRNIKQRFGSINCTLSKQLLGDLVVRRINMESGEGSGLSPLG